MNRRTIGAARSLVLLTTLAAWLGAQEQVHQPADLVRYEETIPELETRDAVNPPPDSSIRRWDPRIEADLAPLTIIPRRFGALWDDETLDKLKNIFTILALVAASLYFCFRGMGGWLKSSTSLDIETTRIDHPTLADKDVVRVSMTVTNGANGSIRIHDAALRVTAEQSGTMLCTDHSSLRFDGITCKAVKENHRLDMAKDSELKQPALGPGQQNAFATFVVVPRDEICTIEVSVVTRRYRQWWPGQAQSVGSAVSLPGTAAIRSEQLASTVGKATPQPSQGKGTGRHRRDECDG